MPLDIPSITEDWYADAVGNMVRLTNDGNHVAVRYSDVGSGGFIFVHSAKHGGILHISAHHKSEYDAMHAAMDWMKDQNLI